MTELDAVLCLRTNTVSRRVRLAEYLNADAEEDAARQANAWIKSLRHARVDRVTFRERFTYLDDSLWWFAELYLHKSRSALSLFRTLNVVTTLLDREAPDSVELEQGGEAAQLVVCGLTRARGLWYEGTAPPQKRSWLPGMDVRSTALMMAAMCSPGRPWRSRASTRPTVAAFVHRAFWRAAVGDEGEESYIGPVLRALAKRLPAGALEHIGVGPTRNFRARRWWTRSAASAGVVRPIEHLVPRTALAGSFGVWAARNAMRRALSSSEDLRSAAVIRGCDCWPVIDEALAGIALLQFPWSARAMDEAGAALDVLEPSVAVTYAEAGGWGRALALEARRRKIPLAGLQHGFIYRHWLNYLHEPDEMEPLPPPSRDAGFPRPTLTLVFDDYAARHLTEAARFPRNAVAVAGSPRLDELVNDFRSLSDDHVEIARITAGAHGSRVLILLVTKYTDVAGVLPHLLRAVASMPDVQLAIKTHPAETPDPYIAAVTDPARVRVLPASAPLAPLLRASKAVVTVNSTVALDAMTLGVPALTIGLPNNLTPFVDAGALVGAAEPEEIGLALNRLLYDHQFRQQLRRSSALIVETFRMVADGGAAERQASIVLDLVKPTR